MVTDLGRPVARLVPLVGGGRIEPPRRSGLGPSEPVRSPRSIAEVLDEDRG